MGRLRVGVLDVGHGLCVVIDGSQSRHRFVYDCGTHSWPGQTVPPAWRQLQLNSQPQRQVGTIAVSHLHWDHYCGFLLPSAYFSRDVRVLLPRLPRLRSSSGAVLSQLRSEFALRLAAWTPRRLDPSFGPLDISLMRSIRRYADRARPVPLSAGDGPVSIAGETWTVLWPPRDLRLDVRGEAKLKHAVDAYDQAARNDPELAQALDRVREAEEYEAMLDDDPDALGQSELSRPTQTFDETVDFDSGEDVDREEDEEDPRAAAGKALGEAANQMSLILARSSTLILTGDAHKSATTAALDLANSTHYTMVVTPHHGGRGHTPTSLLRLSSQLRASSDGGAMRRFTDPRYGELPGIHHKTSQHGDLWAEVDNRHVIALFRR